MSGKTTIDYVKVKELYDRGMSDAEIAAEVGCAAWSVGKWRKVNGLTNNRWNSGAEVSAPAEEKPAEQAEEATAPEAESAPYPEGLEEKAEETIFPTTENENTDGDNKQILIIRGSETQINYLLSVVKEANIIYTADIEVCFTGIAEELAAQLYSKVKTAAKVEETADERNSAPTDSEGDQYDANVPGEPVLPFEELAEQYNVKEVIYGQMQVLLTRADNPHTTVEELIDMSKTMIDLADALNGRR